MICESILRGICSLPVAAEAERRNSSMAAMLPGVHEPHPDSERVVAVDDQDVVPILPGGSGLLRQGRDGRLLGSNP